MANTAKRVVEDLSWVEGSLHGINDFTADGTDGPRKVALQTALLGSAKSLATVITEMGLANDLGLKRRCTFLLQPRSMRCCQRSRRF